MRLLLVFLLSFLSVMLAKAAITDSLSLAEIDSFTINTTKVEPSLTLDEIVLIYYSIDFEDAVWKSLKGKRLELFYLVDETGNLYLKEVKGTNNPIVIDSLTLKTASIPPFKPATSNGKAGKSMFAFSYGYPSLGSQSAAKSALENQRFVQLHTFNLSDVESYDLKGNHFDIFAGGHYVITAGNIKNYWGNSGGFTTGMSYTGTRKFGGGYFMTLNDFKFKNAIPTPDDIELEPSTNDYAFNLAFGVNLHYYLIDRDKHSVVLESELGLASVNLGKPVDESVNVSKTAFLVGGKLRYTFQLGKNKLTRGLFAGPPVETKHQFDIYLSFKGNRYKHKPLNGAFFEFGLAYRVGSYSIKNLKLKE